MKTLFAILCFLLCLVSAEIAISCRRDMIREHQKCIALLKQYEQRFNYMVNKFEDFEEYEDIKRYFEGKRTGSSDVD